MNPKDINKKIDELQERLLSIGKSLNVLEKKENLNKLEEQTKIEGFWDDINNANKIIKNINNLKSDISLYNNLNEKITNLNSLLLIGGEELLDEINEECLSIEKELEELEIKTLLNKEYDDLNCYLEIHPGAGGTESCDWADMLKRMYLRFCEKNNYQYEIIDEQKGEEAGIKSITMLIKGFYAYGYLKNEKGVHRLVRISPFDANKRRHTSFASITVTPEFNDTTTIEIKDNDLKIDVYHSSGAGGQSVNTSDSAVRITHLPTKIVVTCQNERSQLKNKETAMTMLKNKLYDLEIEKKNQKEQAIKGTNIDINFGSQIRNYVLEPYTLVKDVRTNYETSNASKVLDGDIIDFMIANLKK